SMLPLGQQRPYCLYEKAGGSRQRRGGDAASLSQKRLVALDIATAVEKTLASLGGRLPAEELERSRERLARQALRRRLGLPVLSLFSPEAETPAR
ncbi:MAG TPA: hypothetical protein VLQ45_02745, partial [Thermoanaerobaculia bacterium]|nr:hypothetical protein [Thermoanaerobaculia bacterium]